MCLRTLRQNLNFPHEPGSSAGNSGCVPAKCSASQVPLGCGERRQRQWCWLGLGTLQERAGYLLVQNPLPPSPATGAHSQSPAKRLSLHRLDPHALTVVLPWTPQPAAHTPLVYPGSLSWHSAPSLPQAHLQFLAWLLTPPPFPISHRTPRLQPHPAPAPTPYLSQESTPSPFSMLEPTNGLALPGVHRPDRRPHVPKSDTSAVLPPCPNRTPPCSCLRREPVPKADQQATSRMPAPARRGGSAGGERV